jgi:putative phage-type endonuclease
MSGKRVTPTAVRLLSADADREDWLAARKNGIGSSDVAAILGVSDFNTPLHVFHDKRGEVDDHAGEAALWGTLLEDVVAREWARRNRSVITRVGLVAHVEHNWMRATLDRRVGECPLARPPVDPSVPHREYCALEIKCRSAFKANRWHADVPDDVLAQVTWQMAVTGWDHIHVAVLIGGNDYRQTVVRRDPDVEAFVVGEVTRFRDEHLLTGRPPAWDPQKADALIELDELMHPERVGETDVHGIGDVIEYAQLSAQKSAADKALKRARATLGHLAAGARWVKFGDHLAYELAPVTRTSCDLDRLAEQWPEAYADTVTSKTTTTIRIAPEYRQLGAEQ